MVWGTVISHIGDTVTLIWDNDDEHFEVWSSGDCRYKVDRGLMRFIPPPKERRLRIPDNQLLCKVCGKPRSEKCGCPRQGSLKPEEKFGRTVQHLLTGQHHHDKMESSIEGNALDEEGVMMARKPKVAPVEELEDELEELEELDDVQEAPAEAAEEGNMLTAKAAASAIGTDGRTLRKFLRKKHGTVGQGQRWEIDADDLEALKTEFLAWSKGGGKDKAEKKKTTPKADAAPAPDAELDELDEIEDLEELEELDD